MQYVSMYVCMSEAWIMPFCKGGLPGLAMVHRNSALPEDFPEVPKPSFEVQSILIKDRRAIWLFPQIRALFAGILTVRVLQA